MLISRSLSAPLLNSSSVVVNTQFVDINQLASPKGTLNFTVKWLRSFLTFECSLDSSSATSLVLDFSADWIRWFTVYTRCLASRVLNHSYYMSRHHHHNHLRSSPCLNIKNTLSVKTMDRELVEWKQLRRRKKKRYRNYGHLNGVTRLAAKNTKHA